MLFQWGLRSLNWNRLEGDERGREVAFSNQTSSEISIHLLSKKL